MIEKKVFGYKATDKNLQCRGFQYEVGKEYVADGDIELCSNGFHFCKNPLDVLDYYNLCDSEFHTVEGTGETKDDDKKTVSKKIKITGTIGIPGFVKASIEYVSNLCKQDSIDNVDKDNSAKLASSGYYAKLASSGDYAQLASSGDSAQLASSGDSAKLASSGDSAQLASSGDYAVVAGIGVDNIAKAKKGSWIVLAEWRYCKEKRRNIPTCVRSEQVDGDKIKEDVFYKLQNGEFVESDGGK